MHDDTVESLDCDVQQNRCPNGLGTIVGDLVSRRPSQAQEPAKMPMCSTILVLPYTSQPVVLDDQSKVPPMTPSLTKEEMDAVAASLASFDMHGIATASVRLFGPQRQVRRVWREEFPYVVAFCRAMRKAWMWPATQLRLTRHRRQRLSCSSDRDVATALDSPVLQNDQANPPGTGRRERRSSRETLNSPACSRSG